MADRPPPGRRYKTTLSCAECRRLKLRCDRVFPCTSCQRRGCASICPDGQMPPSGRKEGPSQLEILRSRVQELESKLAALENKASASSHSSPQVDDDGAEESSRDDTLQPHMEDTEDLTESLGTLSITGYGKSRFFGTTGGTAQLLWNIKEDNYETSHSSELDNFYFPPELLVLISAFPSPTPSQASPEIWNWIIANLPPQMEAWSLVETFYENGAYILVPLPRVVFLEQVFSFFYGTSQGPFLDIPRGHRLALLLIVFALAELLDLTKPALPTGGKRFYYLARAALTVERLYEHPTLTAVQVIVLMMLYLNMSDHKDSAELVFVLSGINIKLSMMLGLHRDSAKFNTEISEAPDPNRPTHFHSPREAELRRIVFHEVVHFEVWQALAFGRPSILHFEQYDCKPPSRGPERSNTHEENHAKGQAWSYGFIRECLIRVLDFTLGIKPPKYADIMKLDAKINAYPLPNHVHINSYEEEGVDSSDTASRAVTVLRFSTYCMKEIALLYLHRSYFASAMGDFSDPISSSFGKSVLAGYRSARTIVSRVAMLHEKEPSLLARIYLFWGQLFISCVLGAIVVRCPSCSLAVTALVDLDTASELCQKTAKEGVSPATILPRVLHLRRKAHAAFRLYQSGQKASENKPEEVNVSAELSALAGSSRSRTMVSKSPSKSPAETSSMQGSPASPLAAPNLPPPAPPGVSVAAPSAEVPVYPQYPQSDWPPIVDGLPSTGLSLESFPQETFELSDFMAGDANINPFPADFLSNEGPSSFLKPGSLVEEDHLNDFPFVAMEPTWQSFMQQMGFT